MPRPRSLDDLEFLDLGDFDDEELEEFISWARKESARRYAHAAELYGQLCQEGKRRYQSYKRARALLHELIDELSSR